MPTVIESSSTIATPTVMEVPAGKTAVLNCDSNDYYHNFMFWLLDKNRMIGPGNDYDERKYHYEVLSGKLHIDNITPEESGYYICVSKRIDGKGHLARAVELFVTGSSFTALDTVKLIAIIISIVVIIGSIVIYFNLKKEWRKIDERGGVPVEDTDDEDADDDDVYNPTTTTKVRPVPGPSRELSSEQLFGIDNQGLDTDFNSVFENIQIKTPQHSLI